MGVGGQRNAPGYLTSRKETRHLVYRRFGGPQARSGQLGKISTPPGLDPRTVQLIASRHNDYANPANSVVKDTVGIVTHYGLDGRDVESRSGDIFRTRSDRPWAPHCFLYNGSTGSFPGCSGRGVTLTTHSLLAPRLKKEHNYTSTPFLCLH
jgi:hypothetical protein